MEPPNFKWALDHVAIMGLPDHPSKIISRVFSKTGSKPGIPGTKSFYRASGPRNFEIFFAWLDLIKIQFSHQLDLRDRPSAVQTVLRFLVGI